MHAHGGGDDLCSCRISPTEDDATEDDFLLFTESATMNDTNVKWTCQLQLNHFDNQKHQAEQKTWDSLEEQQKAIPQDS